jgi:hypothetical protein
MTVLIFPLPITIVSRDGIANPSKTPRTSSLFLPAQMRGNMSYDLQVAQILTQKFPVLLFDYRGFGSSQAFAYDANAIGHPEYQATQQFGEVMGEFLASCD